MSANNHDRPVTLSLTAERARKIAAGLYGVADTLKANDAAAVTVAELEMRRQQCLHIAKLFEDACNQPDLPGTEETALGKL